MWIEFDKAAYISIFYDTSEVDAIDWEIIFTIEIVFGYSSFSSHLSSHRRAHNIFLQSYDDPKSWNVIIMTNKFKFRHFSKLSNKKKRLKKVNKLISPTLIIIENISIHKILKKIFFFSVICLSIYLPLYKHHILLTPINTHYLLNLKFYTNTCTPKSE